MDSTNYLLIALVALGLTLIILYLIIKGAVKSALQSELKQLVRLKELELKSQGVLMDEIKKATSYDEKTKDAAMKQLQREAGKYTSAEFALEKKKIDEMYK